MSYDEEEVPEGEPEEMETDLEEPLDLNPLGEEDEMYDPDDSYH